MLETVEYAILAEFKRQLPDVYFWDQADADLLSGGSVQKVDTIFHKAGFMFDRFDMKLVAEAAINALRIENET